MDAVSQLGNLKAWMVQRLPGCTDEVMEQALRDAWRDFCIRTEWWRPALDLNLVAEQTVYPLTLPSASHIQRIAGVFSRTEDDVTNRLDGRPLPATAYDVLNNDQTGIVSLYLKWTPREAATGAIRVRPILVPKLATQAPPPVWILERWGDALASGAVWALAKQSGKPWSDPKAEALVYAPRNEFMRAVAQARKENVAGLGGEVPALRGPDYPVSAGWNDMPWGGPK